jgi:hypothetical protein
MPHLTPVSRHQLIQRLGTLIERKFDEREEIS